MDPATAANRLIGDAREQVRWEAARRERRFRRGLVLGVVGSFVVSLIIGGVLVLYLSRQTEDVAQRTAAIVGERVVSDARTARIKTGRDELGRANSRLLARQLPVVPDPGPTATGDALLIQAARANVLADLPESTVGDLRRELGGATALPSSLNADPGQPLGDVVVDELPADSTGSTAGDTAESAPTPGTAAPGGGRAPDRTGSPTSRVPTPAAPAPPATTPRPQPLVEVPVLPLCVPGVLNTC